MPFPRTWKALEKSFFEMAMGNFWIFVSENAKQSQNPFNLALY